MSSSVPASSGPTWLTVPDIAEQLGVSVTGVRQLIRERQLIAVREGGVLRIPAEFVLDGLVVKGLGGTLTLLADAGFSDEESLSWLFDDGADLPGSPITALRENRGREVHRRAQSAGF